MGAPAPRGRLGLILGLSLGGVGVLLIAGLITVFAVISSQHTPQAAVSRFLDTLDTGRATEAVHQLAHVDGAQPLVDDEFYSHVPDRVTSYRVLSSHTSGGTALVRVQVHARHRSWRQDFRLLAGRRTLLWQNWSVDGSGFTAISLGADRPSDIDVTVNGVTLDATGTTNRALLALPGTYRFGLAADSPLVTADAHTVSVASFEGRKRVDLQARLTADGTAKAQAAITAYLDACTSQPVLAPVGRCGFYVIPDSGGGTVSDITWSISQRPVVSFGPWTDGGWDVTTDTAGVVEMNGDYSGPDGAGTVSATFDSYDIDGYIAFEGGDLRFVSTYKEGAGGEAGSGA